MRCFDSDMGNINCSSSSSSNDQNRQQNIEIETDEEEDQISHGKRRMKKNLEEIFKVPNSIIIDSVPKFISESANYLEIDPHIWSSPKRPVGKMAENYVKQLVHAYDIIIVGNSTSEKCHEMDAFLTRYRVHNGKICHKLRQIFLDLDSLNSDFNEVLNEVLELQTGWFFCPFWREMAQLEENGLLDKHISLLNNRQQLEAEAEWDAEQESKVSQIPKTSSKLAIFDSKKWKQDQEMLRLSATAISVLPMVDDEEQPGTS